jgi:hypothetical protein
MVVSITTRKPSKSRQDKRVTANAARNENADERKAGKFMKFVLPDDLLKPIDKFCNRARIEHYRYTIQFGDMRLTTIELYPQWRAAVTECATELENYIMSPAFEAAHSKYVDENLDRLGDMCMDTPVMPLDELRSKIGIEVNAMPFPEDCRNWLTDMQSEQVDEIRQAMLDQQNAAISAVKKTVVQRLAEPVKKMAEALAAYKPADGDNKAQKAFHGTVVANVQAAIDLMPSFNVTNDPDLNNLVADLKALVQHDAKALKESDNIRKSVQAKAEDIADRMSQFL